MARKKQNIVIFLDIGTNSSSAFLFQTFPKKSFNQIGSIKSFGLNQASYNLDNEKYVSDLLRDLSILNITDIVLGLSELNEVKRPTTHILRFSYLLTFISLISNVMKKYKYSTEDLVLVITENSLDLDMKPISNQLSDLKSIFKIVHVYKTNCLKGINMSPEYDIQLRRV